MDAREKQIAAPKSWETFEDLCLALFKAIWNDPLAQKNGRRGQRQHGVDVFGSANGSGTAFFGVQCKGKDQGLGAQATVRELEDELVRAEVWKPPLAHWTFATTAPTDAVLQEAARQLSAERTAKGLFPVSVLGWGDIQALLVEHRSALRQFYPEVESDLSSLIAELRGFPGGEVLAALRRDIADLAARSVQPTLTTTSWLQVTFDDCRDLGPALMGRALGPSDVAACPVLPEAQIAIAELQRAFSARLEGQPGAGKSVCALQAAKDFADRGWAVYKLADPCVSSVTWLPSTDQQILYLIDDGHLAPDHVLRHAEAQSNAARMVLSTHNAIGHGSGGRGAIAMDSKRAVGVIASGLRSNRAETLAVVRRADDRVGDRPGDESLDHRLDYAEKQADRPWQFCFILGGGWRRATTAADAARIAGADITLAAVAIRQMASQDARPSRDELHRMLEDAGVTNVAADEALNWLIRERLVVGTSDLRTPHQRFSSVVLGRILAGQDEAGRKAVGALLNSALTDSAHPLAGLRFLLHEVRLLDQRYIWTGLVDPARLAPLLNRCWTVVSADERMFAMLVLSELSSYIPSWPHSILDGHHDVLARWFSDPQEPSGYGIGHLTNAVRERDKQLANALIGASDAEGVAATVSRASASTAYNLSEMLSFTGNSRPEAWKAKFATALDRQALVALGRNWPKGESPFVYAKLCQALCWTDESLALDMVEAFLPTAASALANDPITAFHELHDIASTVLRTLDVLGVYKGKHRPSERARRLAAQLCAAIKPTTLATQLSATRKRDMQQAAFLLSFLATAAPKKFNQTIVAIDWDQVGTTFGDDWSDLFHDAEVFLGVCFRRPEHRRAVAAFIARNADRIVVMPPRLALMAPEVAYRHVERGRRIALARFDHVDWRYGTTLITYFHESRPDLVEAFLAPVETTAARCLSQHHASWYAEVTPFLRLLRQLAPQSLERILTQLDFNGAEIGWAAALSGGGTPRRAVALLIDISKDRSDSLGEVARRLRTRFARLSVPKADDLELLT